MALPTGTVTFLFSDIEGSTRFWEESPEEMKASLTRHDAVLRGAIESHGGYIFTTAGDAFSAAFQASSEDSSRSSRALAHTRSSSRSYRTTASIFSTASARQG